MTSRPRFGAALLALGAVVVPLGAAAQQALVYDDIAETRAALAEARKQSNAARARAEKLEATAASANQAAKDTAREAAALAARIQQAEAEIAAHEARIALIRREQKLMGARLAEKRQPVVRLTAALQRLSRRPPVLALLRPGSVRETVYMRALLASMLPQIERRTAALRGEIARSKALQARAETAAREMRVSETQLKTRRQSLVAIETRQRLASRQVTGVADREVERALALAEQARDLGELAQVLGKAGAMREQLARLPGPVLRPVRPEEARVADASPAATQASGMASYLLPVTGRLITGFGEARPGQPLSRGIALAARAGAQAVSPAPGRVAFAGPYRGFGSIVIIEHPGGWTSLVTGLAQLDTRVGETLAAGSPLGITGGGRPVVTVELRQDGTPVNPLEYVRGL